LTSIDQAQYYLIVSAGNSPLLRFLEPIAGDPGCDRNYLVLPFLTGFSLAAEIYLVGMNLSLAATMLLRS